MGLNNRMDPNMKFLIFILTVILITPLASILTYINHERIESIIDPQKIEIISTITVGDTCGVKKEFFEVVDLDTDKRVPVRRGKARLKTFQGNRLQLQMSSKYKSVQINLPPTEAKTELTLALFCNDDERLRKTMESLQDNF